MAPPLLALGVGTLGVIALHMRDPHEGGSWAGCPIYLMTGLYCPGCGGLRMVNDLTNLDLVSAASSNLLLLLLSVPTAYVYGRWTYGRWTGRSWSASESATERGRAVALVMLIVFAIGRNTMMGAWLAP